MLLSALRLKMEIGEAAVEVAKDFISMIAKGASCKNQEKCSSCPRKKECDEYREGLIPAADNAISALELFQAALDARPGQAKNQDTGENKGGH